MKKSYSLPQWLLAVVVTALVTAAFLVISFIAEFGVTPSDTQESWGQFGDFVGGILNPLFSIIGLLALLHTIVLQSKELSQSTKELKASARALRRQNKHNARQQFDNNFFQLMSLNLSQANSVTSVSEGLGYVMGRGVQSETVKLKGMAVFKEVIGKFSQGWDLESADDNTWLIQFDSWHDEEARGLDTYMHSLSNIIEFVFSADVSDSAKDFAYTSLSSNLPTEVLTAYLLFATFSENHCWVREILEEIDFFGYCQMDYLNYRPIWRDIGKLSRVKFEVEKD